MPIPIACGSCGAKLVAPDAAAGKKVKCKNCQGVIAVPVPVVEEESDFEFVDPASLAAPKPVAAKPVVAAAVPVKAKSKPAVIVEDENNEEFDFGAAPKKSKAKVVADDDEDDSPKPKRKSKAVVALDDDADEAPRKSKKKVVVAEDEEDDEDDSPRKGKKGKPGKKAAKQKVNPLIFVLGGVGALFAVGFIGVMIWYVAVREKDGTAGGLFGTPYDPPVVVPAGWTQIDTPKYTAHFQDSLGKPKAGTTELRIEKEDGKKVRLLEINVINAAEATAEKNYETTMSVYVAADGIRSIGQKPANLDGKTGREYKLQDSVLGNKGYCRLVHAHGRLYMLIVLAPDWPEADEMARIFFGSVKLKS